MRPIKMTSTMALKIARELYEELYKYEIISDDSIRYGKKLNTVSKNTVKVQFTAEAYNKMMTLVDYFSSEIAWQGTVERIDETHFKITDILVYPQTVTGVTVNTDQEKFTQWLYSLPDEVFNTLRFQGHSHVNMKTNPSNTDLSDMHELIENLDKDDYYIFMIWNKRREFDVRVVDMAKNVLYSGDDVSVTVERDELDDFISEAEQMITSSTSVKEK